MKEPLLEMLICLYRDYLKKTNKRLPQFEKLLSSVTNNSVYNPNIEIPEHEISTIKQEKRSSSTRIFTEQEKRKLDSNCQLYLRSLEQNKIITSLMCEKIIQQIMYIREKISIHTIDLIVQNITIREAKDHSRSKQTQFLFDGKHSQTLH